MNIRNLEYFLAVTEDMNITKAARRIYISQQALSKCISSLEHELGTRLFERSPQLSLTKAGEYLRDAALKMTDTHKVLLKEINDLQSICMGELRIGISFFHSLALMPKILPEYHKNHPLVEVTLVESTAAAMESSLETGQIDMIVTLTPLHLESLETIELGEEKLMLSVPDDVMERRYGTEAVERCRSFSGGVSLEEFFDEPLIMYDQREHLHITVENFYAQRGAAPKILMRTRNLHTAYALSRGGLGVTIFPEYFMHGGISVPQSSSERPVHIFPLTDRELTARLVIAYNRQRYLSRAAQEMISSVRHVLC